jgi:hypothetical protein
MHREELKQKEKLQKEKNHHQTRHVAPSINI